ncbi:hypothetical protein RHMOL_Rhmol07G0213100 [Rhododendron molle]|uniref:Uncharacterized protein n=1 Tax=Rhododendron molle TaxID=49168 RepID=A0ACC0N3B8_RHOML|nr:hypothetical protein RHMOL_Rhmol07G0213100 [Rhododendron molle]
MYMLPLLLPFICFSSTTAPAYDDGPGEKPNGSATTFLQNGQPRTAFVRFDTKNQRSQSLTASGRLGDLLLPGMLSPDLGSVWSLIIFTFFFLD